MTKEVEEQAFARAMVRADDDARDAWVAALHGLELRDQPDPARADLAVNEGWARLWLGDYGDAVRLADWAGCFGARPEGADLLVHALRAWRVHGDAHARWPAALKAADAIAQEQRGPGAPERLRYLVELFDTDRDASWLRAMAPIADRAPLGTPALGRARYMLAAYGAAAGLEVDPGVEPMDAARPAIDAVACWTEHELFPLAIAVDMHRKLAEHTGDGKHLQVALDIASAAVTRFFEHHPDSPEPAAEAGCSLVWELLQVRCDVLRTVGDTRTLGHCAQNLDIVSGMLGPRRVEIALAIVAMVVEGLSAGASFDVVGAVDRAIAIAEEADRDDLAGEWRALRELAERSSRGH